MRNRLPIILLLIISTASLLPSAEYKSRRILEPWYYAFDFYGLGGVPWLQINNEKGWGDGIVSIDPVGIYFPHGTRTITGFVFNYAGIMSTDVLFISQFSLSGSIVWNFRRIGDGYFLRGDLGPVLLHNVDWGTSPAGFFAGGRLLVGIGRSWAASRNTSIQMQLVGTWTLASHFSYCTISVRLGLLL